jgi:hypothetical protein
MQNLFLKNETIKLIINSLFIVPPKPHGFVNQPLKSSLAVDLSEVIGSINQLMPQLSAFISQFHTIVLENGINVITDSFGNMALDVPSSMPDAEAQNLSQRVSILDRIVTARAQEVDGLLQKGLDIENKIKASDPNFKSQILSKIDEFNRLNNSYKH